MADCLFYRVVDSVRGKPQLKERGENRKERCRGDKEVRGWGTR